MQIPKNIASRIAPYGLDANRVGLSGAQVFAVGDMHLKVSPIGWEPRCERDMLLYLAGKVPAAPVVAYEEDGENAFLLMKTLPGTMVCDPALMEQPHLVVDALAQGLHALWRVNAADCPCDAGIDIKLQRAQARVSQGLCSTEDAEPDTYGPGGFADPEALLRWLVDNRPAENCDLVHGDYCLPNLFCENGRFTGFIDLGRGGRGDKYQDIALCYRSLVHNYDGGYGLRPKAQVDPNDLFSALGIAPDWEKIRYYILLDELF